MFSRFKLLIIVWGVFILNIPGFSQILNIEKYRLDKDTSKVWLGNMGMGFSIKKQNTNVYNFNSNLNVAYLSDKHSYMSINYMKIIRQAASNLISEGYAHGRIILMRRNKLSYEPFIQFQYDQGRGLLGRQLYGTTLRYSLYSSKKNHDYIAVNSGFMYENERWKGEVLRYDTDTNGVYAETSFLKSTSNLSVKVNVSKNLTFYLVTYYQARIDKFFKPRIISDIQLQLKVNKHLSLVSQFTSTFDELPVVAGNAFVFSLNNMLVINLGQ